MSIPGDIQNFARQSPEQTDLIGSPKSLAALDYSIMNLWQQLLSVFIELRGGDRRQGGAGMEVVDGFQSGADWDLEEWVWR